MSWSGQPSCWGSGGKATAVAATERKEPSKPVRNRTYFLPEEIDKATATRTIVKGFDGVTVKVWRTQENALIAKFSGLRTAPTLVICCDAVMLNAVVRLIVRGDKSRSEVW